MYRMIHKYRPVGETALNLDMIIHKCINIAQEYYGTKISMTKNAERILVQSDINSLTAQIIQILDTVCLTNNSANVNINVDETQKNVSVIFECEGICNGMTLKFELYTGIPSNVISDKDTEDIVEELIRETFAKAKKIRKIIAE